MHRVKESVVCIVEIFKQLIIKMLQKGAEYTNLNHVHINSEYCVITIRMPIIPPNKVFHAERCETYE
jgi:hypothetical protein